MSATAITPSDEIKREDQGTRYTFMNWTHMKRRDLAVDEVESQEKV